jgi:hypothetical protein
MREYRFNPEESTPIIAALIRANNRSRRVTLIFDTGAMYTHLSPFAAQQIGLSEADRFAITSAIGIGGKEGEGFMLAIPQLITLGCRVDNMPVAVFPMAHLESQGIDGLLGWDFIKMLKLEMDGPGGNIKNPIGIR